jgi:hypothetical protein
MAAPEPGRRPEGREEAPGRNPTHTAFEDALNAYLAEAEKTVRSGHTTCTAGCSRPTTHSAVRTPGISPRGRYRHALIPYRSVRSVFGAPPLLSLVHSSPSIPRDRLPAQVARRSELMRTHQRLGSARRRPLTLTESTGECKALDVCADDA